MSEDKELDRQMSQAMNPRVRDVQVGIRTTRNVKLYPLSIHDQLSLDEVLAETIETYIKESQGSEEITANLVAVFINLIKKKLPVVLKLLFPDENVQKLLKELDNAQLADILELVFVDNYGDPIKKLVSLFKGNQPQQVNESPLERLTRLSAENTPATDSNISPDSATEKVGSHGVN